VNYKMQLETVIGGLTWEYNFEMLGSSSPHERAKDYAKRHTLAFQNVPWFNTLILFFEEEPGDWQFLARFKLATPLVMELDQ
jgi:hypothetical protein